MPLNFLQLSSSQPVANKPPLWEHIYESGTRLNNGD